MFQFRNYSYSDFQVGINCWTVYIHLTQIKATLIDTKCSYFIISLSLRLNAPNK